MKAPVALEIPASPHTRGWTRVEGMGLSMEQGFPAHAGMDPGTRSQYAADQWLPRTRGDGPARSRPVVTRSMASPHTRGWTQDRNRAKVEGKGFPAHAGMDPSRPS